MGPRPRFALAVALFGALVIVAPTAEGNGGSDPIATIACAGAQTGDCTESGNITLPGNTYGSQSTDIVPAKSNKGTELATPFSIDELADFDSNWETIVGAFPKLAGIKNTFVRRVLTCAVMAPSASDALATFSTQLNKSTTAKSTDTSQLFLTLCLQMVYATQIATPTHPVRAAVASCGLRFESIPVEIRRIGNSYTAQATAMPRKSSGRTALRVSCRKKGLGVQITMRARTRSRKLRQVFGGHMGIGFSNPTTNSVAIHTTFSFSK